MNQGTKTSTASWAKRGSTMIKNVPWGVIKEGPYKTPGEDGEAEPEKRSHRRATEEKQRVEGDST